MQSNTLPQHRWWKHSLQPSCYKNANLTSLYYVKNVKTSTLHEGETIMQYLGHSSDYLRHSRMGKPLRSIGGSGCSKADSLISRLQMTLTFLLSLSTLTISQSHFSLATQPAEAWIKGEKAKEIGVCLSSIATSVPQSRTPKETGLCAHSH